MALRPTQIVRAPYLYACGNTPAVCLTETVSPDQDASLLLLGCGDVRNILCTIHADAGAGARKLDFTCCDIEAEIIARNVFILTLILDAPDTVTVKQLWSIYYHAFIDTEDMATLQAHASKLVTHAESLQEWTDGPYAKVIRFCDSATLADVRKLWQLYAIDTSNAASYAETQTKLKSQWNSTKEHHSQRVEPNSIVLTGLRAALPLLHKGLSDMPKHYRTFWQSGTCYEDKKTLKKLRIANPMFICLRSNLMLHYGTSPTTGFPLATTYAELAKDSPSSPTGIHSALSETLQGCLQSLDTWCKAFREAKDQVVIRYVCADAIAFCNVLQQIQCHTTMANWHRNSHTYQFLALDSEDYRGRALAPTSFDVIDTSNLIDHLGALNLLAACSELLCKAPSSTIRTEMLLPREADMATSIKTLLCGDLPTVALVLGLKPVQYWTNTSATWHMSDALANELGPRLFQSVSRLVILWKSVNVFTVQYDSKDLARVLFGTYLGMFQDECWSNRFGMLGIEDKDFMSRKIGELHVYSRASFVALLKIIRSRNCVDFLTFLKELFERIFDDTTLNMGPHNFQALVTQLEIQDVIDPTQIFPWWCPDTFLQYLAGPFKKWVNMPPVVCVTLIVPFPKVSDWDSISKMNGTPLCQIQVASSVSMKQAIYSDVQIGFGTVEQHGTPFTNDSSLSVQEKVEDWSGRSNMIVSAYVSAGALVEFGGGSGRVIFQLKNTPNALGRFMHKFGMFLTVHESKVGNADVFITRHRPNVHFDHGHPASSPSQHVSSIKDPVTIKPKISKDGKVNMLQAMWAIDSEEATQSLQNGGIVTISTIDITTLEILIGDKVRKRIVLPMPIDSTIGKTKVARKSLWIEYTAPIANAKLLASRADAIFPFCSTSRSSFVLENLAYINISILPLLKITNHPVHTDWLDFHIHHRATMSASELHTYTWYKAHNAAKMPPRLRIKEHLTEVFAHVLGHDKRAQASVLRFCSACATKGQAFAVLYVHGVRLDLSNQTIFLDAALSCKEANDSTNTVVHTTTITNEEMVFWKHIFCAAAERCRTWKHKDSCEYIAAGKIPVSCEGDSNYLCSCGLGVFPKNYLAHPHSSTTTKKNAVRIALPLIFASPISPVTAGEDVYDLVAPPPTPRLQEIRPTATELPSAAESVHQAPKCFSCERETNRDGKQLRRCTRCGVARYCSRECQRSDWKAHKDLCMGLADATGDDHVAQ